MSLSIDDIVRDVAEAMRRADALGPVAVSSRSGRVYQPGIGPHGENAAMALMLEQLRYLPGCDGIDMGQFLSYPNAPRQKCDLWFGDPLEWVVEVKMARFQGDNGKPDDSAVKDLLSPYPQDRSAVTDCVKLSVAPFECGRSVLIYGFDSVDRPLEVVIDAFEVLANQRVTLGVRCDAPMGPLVHPVFTGGRVFAWDVSTLK